MTALDTAIAKLTGLKGHLIRPTDAGYDTARTVTYGGIDNRPGLIVRVADAADVQLAVNAARDSGVPFAVRSGGHSAAGHSTNAGGLVIDVRDLNGIDIDTVAKTAWVGTGASAIDVTRAAGAHGMVVPFGDAGTVGVGGITLGGGVGYMARKYGLTIDTLMAAEIVTADGKWRAVDATQEPELFWALRGGGGNFGVVTRFKFRLNPLPAFTGGMLCLPATADTIAGFIAAAEAAPDALSTIANVMPCPPMPFVPAEVHGQLVILGMLAFAGAGEAATKALAPFRKLATPYADFIKDGDYAATMYQPEDPDYHPTAVSRTMFMDRVGVAEAATIVDELTRSDAAFKVTQLRVLGGATARVAAGDTAYAHRSSRVMVNVAAFYTTPEDRAKQAAWVVRFGSELEQDDTGAYVNFLSEDGTERMRAAYPGATWERLRAVKKRYDPANLFRSNQNIPPAD